MYYLPIYYSACHTIINHEEKYIDTKVIRPEIRCELACERILELGNRQRH